MLITITYYLKHFLRHLWRYFKFHRIYTFSKVTRHFAFRMLMRINSGSIVRKIVRNTRKTRCKIMEILEINVTNKVVSRPNYVIRSCYYGLVLTNPYSDYRSLLPLCVTLYRRLRLSQTCKVDQEKSYLLFYELSNVTQVFLFFNSIILISELSMILDFARFLSGKVDKFSFEFKLLDCQIIILLVK